MKNTIKIIVLSLIFSVIWSNATAPVSAGLASFKTALVSAVQGNFTAPQRTEISNAFVSAYQTEWNARVASGTVDNQANRATFAADKVIDYINGIRTAELRKASLAAVPTPTPLPQ